jgi:methylated-DNA-[protein]-cysteine S-methyltransferase
MTRRKIEPRATRAEFPVFSVQFSSKATTHSKPNPPICLKSEISNLESTSSVSPFARRVYAALQKVPRGRVITYAALARRIGCRSPRAIGQALRANPFAPQVPCHRVIASDLSPGGFQGRTAGPALTKKLRLLATEGVTFKNNRLADPHRAIR